MQADNKSERFQKAFDILGRRWNGQIIRSLMEQPLRFSALARRVGGVSDRVLSQRLSELEGAGLVTRVVHADRRPVVVEYALTAKGKALQPSLNAVQAWADEWLVETDAAASQRHLDGQSPVVKLLWLPSV